MGKAHGHQSDVIDSVAYFSEYLSRNWYLVILVVCASGLLRGTVYLLHFKVYPFDVLDVNDIVQISIQNLFWFSSIILIAYIVMFSARLVTRRSAGAGIIPKIFIGLFFMTSLACISFFLLLRHQYLPEYLYLGLSRGLWENICAFSAASFSFVGLLLILHRILRVRGRISGLLLLGIVLASSAAAGRMLAVQKDLRLRQATYGDSPAVSDATAFLIRLNVLAPIADTSNDNAILVPAQVDNECSGQRVPVWSGDKAMVLYCMQNQYKYILYKDYGVINRRTVR